MEGVQDFLPCRALKYCSAAELFGPGSQNTSKKSDFGIGTLGGLLILEGSVSFSTALNYLVWQLCTLKYLEWVLLSD